MAGRRKRDPGPELCEICRQVVTEENWRIHFDHWIEAKARQLVREGRHPDSVGTAFQPAMNRILAARQLLS
jgi:hypothetical protein